MAAVTGLVRRVLFLSMAVATNQALMSSFITQVTPLLYSDSFGTYAAFGDVYTLDSTQQLARIEWLMTPANDATFLSSIMPGMLSAAGLAGIETYTVPATAGY